MARLSSVLVLAAVLGADARAQISGFNAADSIARHVGPRPDSMAGNSVDTGTGAFRMELPVLKVQGRREVELKLTYNSLLGKVTGPVGRRWSHNFGASLFPVPKPTDSNITLVWGNGWNTFHSAGESAGLKLWTGSDDEVRYDRLQHLDTGWKLSRQDGTVYQFDNLGQLVSVADKVGEALDIGYNGTRVGSIHEPKANRYLFLRYKQDDSGLLEAVTDADDRLVYFKYDTSQRLIALYDPVTVGENQGDSIFSSIPIPDNNSTGITQVIHVTSHDPIGLVVLQQIWLSHPRPTDLRVQLISPHGTQVQLVKQTRTGTEWHLDGMVLDNFAGEDPAGDWRVIVTDRVPGQTGFLQVCKIAFTEPAYATRFQYNSADQMTGADAQDGERLFTNQYDAQGRVIAQDDGVDTNKIATFNWQESAGALTTTYTDRTGASSVFVHDAGYHLLRTVNPLNQATFFEYNSSGDRIAVTNPLGNTIRFGYDTSGNLTSVTDAAGAVTKMTYESPSNHDVIEIHDALQNFTRFTYDGLNRIVKVRDAEGYQDSYDYGPSGGVSSASSGGTSAKFFYDSSTMLTSADHPAPGYSRPGARYDNIGRLTSTVDADGFETKYEYNSRGDTLSTTDPRGKSVINHYDVRGRLTERIDRNGNSTKYSYDGNGNVITETNALNQTMRYKYDGEDRLIRKSNALGFGVTQQYDAGGELVAETDAEGNTFRYKYDAAGNLIEADDAEGVLITRYVYDKRGLPVSEENALGQKTTTTYDDVGRPVMTVDALGNKTVSTYDKIGRLSKVTDPLKRSITQAYLQDDLVEYFTDAKGHETRFRYDEARRLLEITANSGRLTQFRYNGRDMITQELAPAGRKVTYSYDGAGRQTRVIYTSASGAKSDLIRQYDDHGNTLRVAEQGTAGQLARTYDAANRVTSFTDASGARIQYGYDAAGNLTKLTYPDGQVVLYGYDRNGRLTRVTDWAGRVTSYSYDSDGRLIGTVFPNGTRRTSDYDAAGRLVRRRESGPSGTILDLSYRFDAVGRMAGVAGGSAPPLSSVQPAKLTFDGDNRLASFNGQAVSFDTESNMIRGPLQGASSTFTYDLRNNLTRVGTDTAYVYDAEDHLVAITHQNRTTALTVNPQPRLSQILMTSESGAVVHYVYGIGLLYEERGKDIRVYHYDHAGNTVAFSSSSGTITGRVSYGPYGEILDRSGDTASPFLYGGMFGVYTDSNGLSNMRFRWYSAEIRRFLNEDAQVGTMSRLASLNRFSYAGNNPIGMSDPDGEIFELLGGIVVGAIAGVAFQFAFDLARGQWSSWEDYAGAAYSGAWTGLVLAACPTCLFTAGALGASAGYLFERGLLQEKVDPVELAAEGIVGGATFWLAGKAGEKFAKSNLSKAISGRMTKVGDYFSELFASKSPPNPYVQAIKNAVVKSAKNEDVQTVAKRFAGGLAQGVQQNLLDPATPAMEPGKAAVYAAARLAVTRGRVRAYGEFAHFQFYLDSLRLAGRPQPTLSNNLLTVY